jgi:hypothetical protein
MEQNILQAVANRGFIQEREIITLKSRLNRGDSSTLDLFDGGPVAISEDQTKKGLSWLLNQYKTPRGVERKNNPFGRREVAALESFERFELVDFIDGGNRYVSFFLPVYRVIGSGASFDYYVNGGACVIIG